MSGVEIRKGGKKEQTGFISFANIFSILADGIF